jgi:tetratricopeptide (TPR) repeat protein
LTATLLKAWSYAAGKELNLALKALDKLDSNDSFANFRFLHEGLIADMLDNDIRAEASYKAALEGLPSSLRVTQAYGNFLERHGRAAEAQKLYEAFNDDRDPNPLIAGALAGLKKGQTPAPFIASAQDGVGEALFSLASAMTDDQSVEIGLMYAEMAMSFSDDAPVVTTLIGDLYESMNQEERAIAAYDEVPADSPLRGNSDIEIASNLHRLERSAEAINRLDQLIAREPTNYSAIVTLGNIHRNNESYKEAGATYERAMALLGQPAKEHWRVYYFAGISYERQKQWPTAEKYFRRALELSPDESSVLNYLGYSMIDMGINLSEAIEMVKKAAEAKPNDGYIVDSLGWAYYKLGNYEEALTHLERAVELLPADPIIGEHLGDVYWRVGRTLEAKFQWQHAKDNKPEPEDLKRIEGKIKDGLPEEAPVTPVQNGTTGNNG